MHRGRHGIVMALAASPGSRVPLGDRTIRAGAGSRGHGAGQGLKLMCTEFGGFDPKVNESAATSTPTLDPHWRPIRRPSAISLMAEEPARAICPPDVAVVPVRPRIPGCKRVAG